MRIRTERRGNVCVLVAVCLTALMGVVAIAIDGGLVMDNRLRVQAGADASALAAAEQLFLDWQTGHGLDTAGRAKTAAENLASQNGFTLVPTVNIPPLEGPFAGKPNYAEVIVRYSQKRYFSSIFGSTNITVTARAVAEGGWKAASNGILVLDPTAPGSLTDTGNGTVTVQGASLIVDSSAPDGGTATGGGTVSATTADFSGMPGYGGSGTWSGTLNSGVPPTPDPLAGLPEPTTAGMASFNKEQDSGKKTVTISPGVYHGGISISGQATLIMKPGIYYMDGGGFSFTGQGSLVANGVMIFNAPQSNSDVININGSGSITLSPPTGGTYQGIALFQQRSSTNTVSVTGNGTSAMTGTFYVAGGTLNVTGNGSNDVIGSQYISNLLKVNGGGNFKVVWDVNLVGHMRVLRLVE